MYKIFPVDIIQKKEIKYGGRTEYFNPKETAVKPGQVKQCHQQAARQQLNIANSADHFEIINIKVMINQFHWFGKMETIRNDHFRIIFFHPDNNGPAVDQRINIGAIYYGLYFKKAE